jgi:hypothetical protein
MRDKPINYEQMAAYLTWHQEMSAKSNEDLCRELLKSSPVLTKLDDLVSLVVERLVPGLIDKMGDEEDESPATTTAQPAKADR